MGVTNVCVTHAMQVYSPEWAHEKCAVRLFKTFSGSGLVTFWGLWAFKSLQKS